MSKKIVVSFRIEKKLLDEFKSFARHESVKENRNISFAEIIREMIKKKVEKH